MQGSPLLNTASYIQVKKLQALISEQIIKSDYTLNAPLLSFPTCNVNGSPVVIILDVDFRSTQNELLCD